MKLYASKFAVVGVCLGAALLVLFAASSFTSTAPWLALGTYRNRESSQEHPTSLETDPGRSQTLSLIKQQRDRVSAQLDAALQRLGQLECQVSQNRGEVSGTGGWCERFSQGNSGEHATDAKLATALINLFRYQTVASFGDGPGEYKALVDASGAVRSYDAYDGAPFVEQVTNGSVHHLDLSVERFGLPVYDWVLSLEVAEHIPAAYEDAFLSNVVRHARRGVVLSWAVPGQGGFHHVNLRPFEYVEERFSTLGFIHDPLTSANLRQHSSLPWLQNNVNVFRRKKEVRLDVDQA